MNPASFNKNILKLYLYKLLSGSIFIFTINILFFQSKGISITEIALLDVIWAIAAFVTEVPSGVLSDRWSRKGTLSLSSLWVVLAMIVFIFADSFLILSVGIVLLALSTTFASGTFNAILYDELDFLGKANKFEFHLGRLRLAGVSTVVVAGILGGLLASEDVLLPYWLTIVPALLASVTALLIKENKIRTKTEDSDLFRHVLDSFNYVRKSPIIIYAFLYLVFMDIGISYLDEYDQLLLNEISFPVVLFGVWIGGRRLLSGIAGIYADRIKRSKITRPDLIALAIMLISLLGVYILPSYLALLPFLVIFPAWGLMEVITLGDLQRNFTSKQRATMESFIVFFGVLIDIPIRIVFGLVSEEYGIRTGYLYTFIVIFVFGIFYMAKNKLNKN